MEEEEWLCGMPLDGSSEESHRRVVAFVRDDVKTTSCLRPEAKYLYSCRCWAM